jgi:hypothetical protein
MDDLAILAQDGDNTGAIVVHVLHGDANDRLVATGQTWLHNVPFSIGSITAGDFDANGVDDLATFVGGPLNKRPLSHITENVSGTYQRDVYGGLRVTRGLRGVGLQSAGGYVATVFGPGGTGTGVAIELDSSTSAANLPTNAALAASGAGLAGDYNRNGVVDLSDHTVWRDKRGSSAAPWADGNGNGVVDEADRDIWKANFGQRRAPAERQVLYWINVLSADYTTIYTFAPGEVPNESPPQFGILFTSDSFAQSNPALQTATATGSRSSMQEVKPAPMIAKSTSLDIAFAVLAEDGPSAVAGPTPIAALDAAYVGLPRRLHDEPRPAGMRLRLTR